MLKSKRENEEGGEDSSIKSLLVRKIILATMSRFFGLYIEDSGSPLSLALLSLFGIVLEPKSSISIPVKWVPLPLGWIKINSDGSLGDDRYGFGAVARDPRGDCILAMAKRSQAASINILELKGLLAGLRLQNLPGSLVWSELDSTTVVAWALGRGLIPWNALRDLQISLRHGNLKLTVHSSASVNTNSSSAATAFFDADSGPFFLSPVISCRSREHLLRPQLAHLGDRLGPAT
ncbi:hypothetical protein QJS10_CPA01g01971 [Acorus calamus]|uniref:RNase H type-1 domain-containing protein n=1 Tax=Acorus calamus TaxID=4465 RepID=A0AAV9FLX2_ACOCL|nr:hypothetical protein QJS10_CPA01g01971 [Acorus calamus]